MSFKTIFTELINKNPWCEFKHDHFAMPSGKEGDYYYVETPGAAMIVPLMDDGRLVLVSQYRYLGDKNSVEFPCGRLELGEVPSASAQREMLEETGWNAHDLIKIGTFEGLNGLVRDSLHVFVGRELMQVRGPQTDEMETIELLYRRPDELDDMIKRGEIWDGQTLAAWAFTRDFIRNLNQSL